MKLQWVAIAFFSIVLLLVTARSVYYHREYEKALARAEAAEREVTVLKLSEEKLTLALEDQQRATQEAQSQTKVVYKTIQKEVAKDATARDWYHTAVPESLVRVLKANAGAN